MSAITHYAVLRKYPVQPVFNLLCAPGFPSGILEDLLADILTGQEPVVESLLPWIAYGQPKYKTLLYAPVELALDVLMHQPSTWLNDRHLFLEAKFRQALVDNNQAVLARLKTLVAGARAGISTGFLRGLLQDPPFVLAQREELDIWILIAKLQERVHEMRHHDFEQELGEKLEQKPWLLVVLIYVFREKNPFVALDLLLRWDENKEYQPSEEIRAYVTVYLRHALYNLLHAGVEENYTLFFNLLYSLEEPYLHGLLQDTLKHEFLREIAEACAQRDMAQNAGSRFAHGRSFHMLNDLSIEKSTL